MFVHVVLFWLKEDAPAGAGEQILRDLEPLRGIPAVRGCWTGVPAGTPRPVVDNSYSVGLTVLFDDQAGHDLYQDHPLHQEFLARNKQNWSRVQIYDFVG